MENLKEEERGGVDSIEEREVVGEVLFVLLSVLNDFWVNILFAIVDKDCGFIDLSWEF